VEVRVKWEGVHPDEDADAVLYGAYSSAREVLC
jgi:hypothetical protein